jgi:hypothetical protein
MATLLQFRRDTSANWISVNPVLAEGELGLETDTSAYKIGNGVDNWNTLLYYELSSQVQTLLMSAQSSDPTPPGAGSLLFYGKSVAGRSMPKFVGPSGLDTVLQPGLFGNGIQMLSPNTTTTFNTIGMPSPTAVGTVSHPTLSSGSLRVQTRRGIVTSAATANSASELRQTATSCWRGDTAGQGGFFMTTRFAMSTAVANQRTAVGLFSTTTAISTSQSPSSLTSCIFVGNDSADTTMQIMHNDASGTCTKINLGANFPSNNTSAVYEVILFAAPNSSQVEYRVIRQDTGSVATGTLTTDLPPTTTFLAWHAYMNNGGTASAVVLEIMRYYLETDY